MIFCYAYRDSIAFFQVNYSWFALTKLHKCDWLGLLKLKHWDLLDHHAFSLVICVILYQLHLELVEFCLWRHVSIPHIQIDISFLDSLYQFQGEHFPCLIIIHYTELALKCWLLERTLEGKSSISNRFSPVWIARAQIEYLLSEDIVSSFCMWFCL